MERASKSCCGSGCIQGGLFSRKRVRMSCLSVGLFYFNRTVPDSPQNATDPLFRHKNALPIKVRAPVQQVPRRCAGAPDIAPTFAGRRGCVVDGAHPGYVAELRAGDAWREMHIPVSHEILMADRAVHD
jgi:hypothetical protein